MSSSAPRTLADQLRGWSADELAALLEARPDLAAPAPQDSAQLAARASTRPSVMRAIDDLTVLDLTVLEVVVNEAPMTREALAARVNARDITAPLGRLRDRVLIWGDDQTLRPLSVLTELIGSLPGPDPEAIPGLLGEIDDRARAILDHLDVTGSDGKVDVPVRLSVASATTPTEHLLARRLLVPRDSRHVLVPWSVKVALRGGRSTQVAVDEFPSLALGDRDPALIDRTAAGAAFEFVRRTELLLDRWGTNPPVALRGGGLGVRELKAAALLLHVEPIVAGLVIETASAAGLLAVGMGDGLDSAWLPTEAFDIWQGRSTGERWARLANAWLENNRLTGTIGGRVADKPVNALSDGLERSWLVQTRTDALAELAATEPGQVLATTTGLPSLLERLRWLRPRRPVFRSKAIDWSLTEAGLLGVTGLDGLSSFGRLLLAGEDPVVLLEKLLPAPVDHILLQADLTAIAPGPLEQDLARQLGLVADVESRGGATTYRFTPGSVRRAFDAGWAAAEVHDFVASTSRTPVPQALTYLVDDVARRFGNLRAGTAESFLRSDDETALTELMHNPAAGSLRLRRIAPTVVISDVALGILLPRLRELGAAPVVEAADGTVRLSRPDVFRSRAVKRRSPAAAQVRSAARTAAVVAAIRSGDRVAASRPERSPVSNPADVMALLREAVETGSKVLIGYVGNDGSVGERIVAPRYVEGGQLTAYDERADDTRSFAVHRITRASVA